MCNCSSIPANICNQCAQGNPCGCPPDYSVMPIPCNQCCPPGYTYNGVTVNYPFGSCIGAGNSIIASIPCPACEEVLSTDCIFVPTLQNCISGTTLTNVLNNIGNFVCDISGSTKVTSDNVQVNGPIGCLSGSTATEIFNSIASIVCGKGDTLKVYYVDSHNNQSGDGSVVNPFQTLDLAYNAIIGNGTIVNPQNPNVNVSVAGGEYTTNINIYIPGITWSFDTNAVVNYTGTSYFIDSGVIANVGVDIFQVEGGMRFNTSTGGFVNHAGATNTSYPNKDISIQCFSIFGNTPATGHALPLIVLNETNNTSFAQITLTINLQNSSSSIYSYYQHTISVNGGNLFIDCANGQLTCGVPSTGGVTNTNNIVNYNNPNSPSLAFSCITNFTLQNARMFSSYGTDMITVTGLVGYFILDNLQTENVGNSIPKPDTFLNIGAVTVCTSLPLHQNYRFLLKEVYLDNTAFSNNRADVVTSVSGSTLPYLQMEDCVLYSPLTIGSNINLGGITPTGDKVTNLNILKGLLHLVQIPIYANNAAAISAGLVAGDVYQTGTGSPPSSTGQLMIVY